MKKFVCLALTFLLILTLSACGAAPKESAAADTAAGGVTMTNTAADYGYKTEVYYDEAPAEPAAPAEEMEDTQNELMSGVMQPAKRPAKLIYSAEMEMETLAFDDSHTGLEDLVADLDGYFESKSVYNANSGYRRGEYTVRVPADKFRTFLDQVGALCQVTYTYENADDISESYYDTDARLTTARAKLERLQELLKRAETMEDIITIESAISDTEYTIDRLSGTLRNYDSLVDYATIHVAVREVYQLSGTQSAPITFGERLGSSFSDGLYAIGRTAQDFALWLAYSWFWLVIAAIAIFVIVRVVRKKGKLPRRPRMKHKNKTENENNTTNGKEN